MWSSWDSYVIQHSAQKKQMDQYSFSLKGFLVSAFGAIRSEFASGSFIILAEAAPVVTINKTRVCSRSLGSRLKIAAACRFEWPEMAMKWAANSLLNTTVSTSRTMPPDNHSSSFPPRSSEFWFSERRVRLNLHTTWWLYPPRYFLQLPGASSQGAIFARDRSEFVYIRKRMRASICVFCNANQFLWWVDCLEFDFIRTTGRST